MEKYTAAEKAPGGMSGPGLNNLHPYFIFLETMCAIESNRVLDHIHSII